MIGSTIDRAIGAIWPAWGLRRMAARATMSQIEAIAGSPMVGYEAGKVNSGTRGRTGARSNENALPRSQISRLRWQAWNLFRNNTYARKIVRTLVAKTIGQGPQPQSQATHADGTPHIEFRAKAQELWQAVENDLDYRGKPGYGGQSRTGLLKTALKSVILNGEILWRFRPISPAEQKKNGLHIPLKVQLIDPERLVDQNFLADSPIPDGNFIFHGIELNQDGQRVAYWILNRHPSDPSPSVQSMVAQRYLADKIGHLFVDDDVDQLRGVSWFAVCLLQMRDTGDYQYNELKASAVAACPALGVRRPKGAVNAFGVLPQNWDLTDGDGNRLTAMQPGMILDLGEDGEIQGFNPSRPTGNAETFIQHMLRGTAAGMPGVKSSTVTGDYRNASFSSERAADNDTWPEIQDIQTWFYTGLCQSLYEAIISSGIESGYFDGVITAEEFKARKIDLLANNWQGPVLSSIKPSEDAQAARERIKNGTSTPQIESAALGRDWRENLKAFKEFRDYATTLGIEDNLIDQMLGLETQATVAEVDDEGAAEPQIAKGTADAA